LFSESSETVSAETSPLSLEVLNSGGVFIFVVGLCATSRTTRTRREKTKGILFCFSELARNEGENKTNFGIE
jgi:hypothetical protein